MRNEAVFREACAEVERLDKAGAVVPIELLMRMFSNAPDSFIGVVDDLAQEMGLMPKPAGLDKDGRPVYDVEDIAARLGVDAEEVKRTALQIGGRAELVTRAH